MGIAGVGRLACVVSCARRAALEGESGKVAGMVSVLTDRARKITYKAHIKGGARSMRAMETIPATSPE